MSLRSITSKIGRAGAVLPALLITLTTSAVSAQQTVTSPAAIIPRLDLSAGYSYLRANSPPGDCDCFHTNGGYLSAGVHVTNWLSFEGEVTGQHQNHISNLGQNLTLLTFAGGPRVSLPGHRYIPFGEVLIGAAHGSDSYFPTGTTSSPTATNMALSAGGGLDFAINKRFAIRAFDVQFLKTAFPNGTNNSENHLTASAGIVVRFGKQGGKTASVVLPHEDAIALSCTSSVNNIDQGDTLEMYANTLTEPDKQDVTYAWTTAVGTIVGKGARTLLDTAGLAPGSYHVIVHAALTHHPAMGADCDIPFRVKTAQQTAKAPTPPPAATNPIDGAADKEFHENVPDALFDYDSSAIRPDAQAAVLHAAEYLQKHPSIAVLIGGYADDRGSAEYNIALGVRRATAARKALIEAGVAPERLQIISYGKEVQVCTAQDEACRQQNRRAAFSMHP